MWFIFENKNSTAHWLGVTGVASFITIDKQLQYNRACFFSMQAMLPADCPFSQNNEKCNDVHLS